MPDIFQITLRDTSGFEHFDHREFDVPVGSSFPIGRASKNTTKKDLMPAVHNAYIDSPVISREHAVLSVPSTDVPHVFITDVASMHGTIVNGEKLTPHAKTQLSPGDLLQFGVDVNRNEEYFTARKYTFEAHFKRAQAPFSMGFTVPDSEGEEIGDSDSDASDNEPIDLTDDCLIQIDDETVAVVDLHSRDNSDPTPVDDILIAQEIFSDNEGGTGYYSSDQQEDELDLNLDSGASHMDESDIDYNSDLQVSDMEDEDINETHIVEDQPPTPTSINSMKRKAEVLEDDEAVIEEQVITHHDVFAPPTVTESAVQTVAEIAQRPKLQPRSVISKVRSTATYIGYSAVGAVSAVALLSYLPDAFFA
ncbi:hypothetical protein GQ44DRAFT_685220 [Phaeosphaeriaceae sp. PMI808]|nr:hypothetical protein GQ44DRAFT_685220 [Phaeosphaeriaceae sp. PMI808]